MLNKVHYWEILPKFNGAMLIDAKYIVYSLQGNYRSIIAVIMLFSNENEITVRCDSDGESLIITQEDAEEGELGDLGRIEVASAYDIDPALLMRCIGEKVIKMIVEEKDQKPKSVRVCFEENYVFISNIGDALDFDESQFRKVVIEDESDPLVVVSFPFEKPIK